MCELATQIIERQIETKRGICFLILMRDVEFPTLVKIGFNNVRTNLCMNVCLWEDKIIWF